MKSFSKYIFITSGLCGMLWASSASAHFHEQLHTCRSASGEFAAGRTQNNNLVGLCRLGPSAIGSMDLVTFFAGNSGVALSVENYKHGIKDCAQGDGHLTKLNNLENNQSFEICHYKDGSMLDVDTLRAGKEAPRNAKLSHALGLQ